MTLEEFIRDNAEEVIIKLKPGATYVSSAFDFSSLKGIKIVGDAPAFKERETESEKEEKGQAK